MSGTISPGSPIGGVELVLADLDGVIYRGPDPIEYAVESINALPAGLPVGYITNNAARTDESVARHLNGLGLSARASDVVTSPQAAVSLLSTLVPAGSTVLVVGGEGLSSEVEKGGFRVTASAEDGPAAVIQGFSPEVGWNQLAEASFALKGGATGIPWVATNTDWTIPQPRGTAPGNGTLVSAVHVAVGRLPIVAGKPEVAIFEAALQRFGVTSALVVGDRLDTDILGANRAGLLSALVLTGIDQPRQILAAAPEERPDYILRDLRQLLEPYPATLTEQDRAGVRTRTGSAVVRRSGAVISIEHRGDSQIDLLRAGAGAIWNSGLSIYGLEVPGELYA